ncbi:MAG: glycosyltransferase [Rhizobiaceae bacterium]
MDQPSEPGRKRRVLLVLGMHRSGTSALTRVINLMGAGLPRDMIDAGLGNEAGHWEPRKIVAFNDRLLGELNSAWFDWRRADLSALGASRLSAIDAELAAIIGDQYRDPVIVLKDPRICRIADHFVRALEKGMGEVRLVHVFRHPVDVAQSLNARNDLPVAYGLLLWLRHVIDAQLCVNRNGGAAVSFESLFSDRQETLARLGASLKLGRTQPAAIRDQIDAFLDPSLRRQTGNDAHQGEPAFLEGWVASAYGSLLALEKNAGDRQAIQVLEQISQEMARSEPLMYELFEEERKRTAARFGEREQSANLLAEQLKEAQTRITGASAEMSKALSQIENLQLKLDDAQKEQARLTRKNSALNKRLKNATTRLERRQAELLVQVKISERESAELSASRRELRSLHERLEIQRHNSSGLFFRVAAFLQNLKRRFMGVRVAIVPRAGATIAAGANGFLDITTEGHDPQLALAYGTKALAPAYYRLSCRTDTAYPLTGFLKIYPDYGLGEHENLAITTPVFRSGRGKCVSFFRLTGEAVSLRLDPPDHLSRFRIARPTIRKTGRAWYLAENLYQMIARRVRSPADIPRLANAVVERLRVGGIRNLLDDTRTAFRIDSDPSLNGAYNYQQWIDECEVPLRVKLVHAWRRRLSGHGSSPRISIIMPVYNPPSRILKEAIDSVLAQNWENWELCIADDCSSDPAIGQILRRYASQESRIKVMFRTANGHISKASNSALELVTGEWVALLDHDDCLAPDALLAVASEIAMHPDAGLIYSDEDKLSEDGERDSPYFKSDWNPDLFLSHNLITHLGVYRTQTVRELGGFRVGYEGAQDYDLALRYVEKIPASAIRHIPHVLYHWRVMKGSTALSGDEKPYAMLAGERALQDSLDRRKIRAKAKLIGIGYHVIYQLPKKLPKVSIIIPTRNAADLLRQCVDSITALTTYANYEILVVDNGSDDRGALEQLTAWEKSGTARIIRDDRPFNFSALNNLAVSQAKGDYVVLMNNDISVISPDWLEEMVGIALQPQVGAVGAKLYYPDDTIQHAGVIMGLGGLAAHGHLGFPRQSTGYSGRAVLRQTLSAVTGALLLVSKENYEKVGGLNEEHLKVAYNDIDFCLKLTALGLRNVWTPHAEFYHHESATRGYDTSPKKRRRLELEKKYMRRHWQDIIDLDPAYSPNLTLDAADFGLAFPPRIDVV